MSTSDGGYTIDTTYDDQLKSPMNLALHWSEESLCWEVIVRFRGRRLGVTQVKRLDDLGQTVLDYVELASDDALEPTGTLVESLTPRQLHASVEDTTQEVIHDFICSCPNDASIGACPVAAQVGRIVEHLDGAGVLRRGEDPKPVRRLKLEQSDRGRAAIRDLVERGILRVPHDTDQLENELAEYTPPSTSDKPKRCECGSDLLRNIDICMSCERWQ